jgi:hypothetical protein
LRDATFLQNAHLILNQPIMKKLLYFFILSIFLLSCSDSESNSTTVTTNKIALLKVDFLTNTFEGGSILNFPDHTNYNLTTDYQAPGDFGGIQIKYDGLNQLIFDGSIHWAGLGERTYPQQIDAANSFALSANQVALPSSNFLSILDYDEFAYYPDIIDYATLWNAINQLTIVGEYRSSNPNATVYFLLYTPSVGLGNPADWDWYILIKN